MTIVGRSSSGGRASVCHTKMRGPPFYFPSSFSITELNFNTRLLSREWVNLISFVVCVVVCIEENNYFSVLLLNRGDSRRRKRANWKRESSRYRITGRAFQKEDFSNKHVAMPSTRVYLLSPNNFTELPVSLCTIKQKLQSNVSHDKTHSCCGDIAIVGLILENKIDLSFI